MPYNLHTLQFTHLHYNLHIYTTLYTFTLHFTYLTISITIQTFTLHFTQLPYSSHTYITIYSFILQFAHLFYTYLTLPTHFLRSRGRHQPAITLHGLHCEIEVEIVSLASNKLA